MARRRASSTSTRSIPDGTRALDRRARSRSPTASCVVLVGPSGCGKSTLLRLVAGLETPTRGDDPHRRPRRRTTLSPQERNVAMVFQDYALYPHMTVRENLEFPLRMREARARRASTRASRGSRSMLDLGAAARPPAASSSPAASASASRWAARWCASPRVSCSTSRSRTSTPSCASQVRAEIAELQRRTRTTMLYVTHDQVEAMTLGHRVAVLNRGRAPAGRAAARALRPAGERVRRGLHRQPADEPLPDAARRERRGPAGSRIGDQTAPRRRAPAA